MALPAAALQLLMCAGGSPVAALLVCLCAKPCCCLLSQLLLLYHALCCGGVESIGGLQFSEDAAVAVAIPLRIRWRVLLAAAMRCRLCARFSAAWLLLLALPLGLRRSAASHANCCCAWLLLLLLLLRGVLGWQGCAVRQGLLCSSSSSTCCSQLGCTRHASPFISCLARFVATELTSLCW